MKSTLREYARRGAQARVKELQDELAEILRTFPDLKDAVPESRRVRAKRKPMSETQKRAVSKWMKKYWADRRKRKAQ